MLILAVIDLLAVRQRILNHTSFSVALAACLAINLNALGAAFTVVHSTRTFLGLRPESTLLLVIYVSGTRAIYRHGVKAEEESPPRAAPTDAAAGPGCSLYRAVGEFVVGTALIFVAAPEFARSAASLAKISGLGPSFVGTWILGFSTALPEFVTSLTAVRIGAFDLAVATPFGSFRILARRSSRSVHRPSSSHSGSGVTALVRALYFQDL